MLEQRAHRGREGAVKPGIPQAPGRAGSAPSLTRRMVMVAQATTPRSSSRQAAVRVRQGIFASDRDLSDSLELMGGTMPFERDCEIYGEGEPADYLYTVVSGAVRTYRVLHDGRRQIAAFHLPGDLFGLEVGNAHACSAEAIARSVILVIRRSAVIALVRRDPEVAGQLWELTARELRRTQNHLMVLIRSAPERIATFLLEMAERCHGGDAVELPMPRQDIADYLGLTIETVSRTLTQLELERTITLRSARRIALRNRSALILLNT
jgi:CRP/FNR family transcriptional regulator, nitrogen fixation regulation protein